MSTPPTSNLNSTIQGSQINKQQSNRGWQIAGGLLLALIVAGLLLAPLALRNYGLLLLSTWAVYTIAVQGLNLTLGYAGQISLAQAAFMGIGAYTSTLLVQKAEVNYWLTILLAGIVCTLVGALIGFPALRVQGHYLAFVTLGFNGLVVLFLRNEEWLTGGALGILNIKRPSFFGISLFNNSNFYYFTLAMLGLVTLAIWYILRSPWGRAFKSLRDNPARAESLGISITNYTLLAFAIGSGFAGIAGAIYAPMIEYIEPTPFALPRSLLFLLMVMVGGRGTLIGPFIGAFFVTLMPEWLRFTEEYYLMIFAVFVMLMMLFFPQGVAGVFPYLQKRFTGKVNK